MTYFARTVAALAHVTAIAKNYPIKPSSYTKTKYCTDTSYTKLNEYQLCSVLDGRKADIFPLLQQLSDHEILLAAEFRHRLQLLDLMAKNEKKRNKASLSERPCMLNASN